MYSTRKAKASDIEPMMKIGHEGIRPYIKMIRGWNQQVEEAGFRQHFVPAEISIVLVEEVPVGYYKVEEHSDHHYLDGIYLASTHRNIGLGSKLIRDLRDDKDKPIRLRVFKSNPAHKLYSRLGFTITEETENHYYMESEQC